MTRQATPNYRLACSFGVVALLWTTPHGFAAISSRAILPAHPDAAQAEHDISIDDYRARLQALDQVVARCRQAISTANCNSKDVGADLNVTLPAGPRKIRYGWLRDLLDQAASRDTKSTPQAAGPSPKLTRDAKPGKKLPIVSPGDSAPASSQPNVPALLEEASRRLHQDAVWVTDAQRSSSANPVNVSTIRGNLSAILAQKEFNQVAPVRSLKQRLMEKLFAWIEDFLGKLIQAGSRSKWFGLTAEISIVVLLGAALVWFFVRLEKRGRFSLTSMRPDGLSEPASARDWQLWLNDARQAAKEEQWRDAIHLLYWSSISRLESSGLWPADRARTPREYLALMKQESAQRPDLADLTRSFERTWYAGRPAVQSDFQQAEALAARLGAKVASKLAAQ
jgi:hypothetical protein